MIVVLTTPKHAYTLRHLVRLPEVDVRPMGYHRALSARQLPRATYIFSDLDRLNFWELELAARLYRTLKQHGLNVLNDPARVRLRYSLLRALKANGFNTFNVWRMEDSERPGPHEYPVFLRTESAHRGNLTDLLHNSTEVELALTSANAVGVPLRELILVQYCAQPEPQGYYCKHASFRIGSQMLTGLPVHESGWSAKYGELGLGSAELYKKQLISMQANEYGEALRDAFDTAGIEFGRVDFGLVNERPQVYEINTNPMFSNRDIVHPDSSRRASAAFLFDQLVIALQAIDSTRSARKVPIEEEKLVAQRRMDRYLLRPRWTP